MNPLELFNEARDRHEWKNRTLFAFALCLAFLYLAYNDQKSKVLKEDKTALMIAAPLAVLAAYGLYKCRNNRPLQRANYNRVVDEDGIIMSPLPSSAHRRNPALHSA